jgi:hypothetical protein
MKTIPTQDGFQGRFEETPCTPIHPTDSKNHQMSTTITAMPEQQQDTAGIHTKMPSSRFSSWLRISIENLVIFDGKIGIAW